MTDKIKMDKKKVKKEKDEDKLEIEEYFETEGLDEMNEKVLVKKKIETEGEVTFIVKNNAGRSLELTIPADMWELWTMSGDYFVRGGRVPTYEDVRVAMDKMDRVISFLDKEIERYGGETSASGGLIKLVEDSIKQSMETALLNLITQPTIDDRIVMREQFKEEFNWGELREQIAELVSKVMGRPKEEVMATIQRLDKGEFKTLYHQTGSIKETFETALGRKGLKISSIKYTAKEKGTKILKGYTEVDRGSHVERVAKYETSVSQVFDSMSTQGGDDLSVGGMDRYTYEARINRMCSVVPQDTIKRYGRETVKSIIDITAKVVMQELIADKEDKS